MCSWNSLCGGKKIRLLNTLGSCKGFFFYLNLVLLFLSLNGCTWHKISHLPARSLNFPTHFDHERQAATLAAKMSFNLYYFYRNATKLPLVVLNLKWSCRCEPAPHSLVSENVSILVGVEGQFEDAIHNAALDRHLGVLQLLLASVLPNGIRGHGTVQVAQKILHRCRLVIRCRAHLERWRGAHAQQMWTDRTEISTKP